MTLKGIGEKRALALAERFGTWDAVLSASDADLINVLGQATGTKFLELRPDAPPTAWLPTGCRIVSIHDAEYPPGLRSIPHSPTLLWVRGTLPPADAPALAVVGTRRPTEYGQSVARLAASEAVKQGFGVVSGLALGCDSLAHTAALDAGGGTWAILGCGIDMVDASGPRADLARRIVANGGGVLAEVPPGTPTASHLLTSRNRLQSGMAAATLIAQSGLPGDRPAGTMHTARFAIEQDRLLVVGRPHGKWAEGEESAGNLALTDPNGCNPQAVYATKPDLVAKIAARKPAADIVLNGRDDLPEVWDQMRTRPIPAVAVNDPAEPESLTLSWS
jgi:DNA processing protein